MTETPLLTHPFAPVIDAECDTLILGSFPSVKSREAGFYYGHPQNRFWRVLGTLYHDDPGQSAAERTAFLLRHHLAVWDAAGCCTVTGSSDASVKNVVPNDLRPLIEASHIRRVFCNGSLSYAIYTKHCEPLTHLPAVRLPSTSPANASQTLDKLCESWRVLLFDNASRP